MSNRECGVYTLESSSNPCYNNSSVCSFIQYNSTSLERGHKHDLLTEVDLGVPIDLILPETYSKTEPASKFVHSAVVCCACSVEVMHEI